MRKNPQLDLIEVEHDERRAGLGHDAVAHDDAQRVGLVDSGQLLQVRVRHGHARGHDPEVSALAALPFLESERVDVGVHAAVALGVLKEPAKVRRVELFNPLVVLQDLHERVPQPFKRLFVQGPCTLFRLAPERDLVAKQHIDDLLRRAERHAVLFEATLRKVLVQLGEFTTLVGGVLAVDHNATAFHAVGDPPHRQLNVVCARRDPLNLRPVMLPQPDCEDRVKRGVHPIDLARPGWRDRDRRPRVPAGVHDLVELPLHRRGAPVDVPSRLLLQSYGHGRVHDVREHHRVVDQVHRDADAVLAQHGNVEPCVVRDEPRSPSCPAAHDLFDEAVPPIKFDRPPCEGVAELHEPHRVDFGGQAGRLRVEAEPVAGEI